MGEHSPCLLSSTPFLLCTLAPRLEYCTLPPRLFPGSGYQRAAIWQLGSRKEAVKLARMLARATTENLTGCRLWSQRGRSLLRGRLRQGAAAALQAAWPEAGHGEAGAEREYGGSQGGALATQLAAASAAVELLRPLRAAAPEAFPTLPPTALRPARGCAQEQAGGDPACNSPGTSDSTAALARLQALRSAAAGMVASGGGKE